LQLLQALSRQLQFSIGRLLGLLDKRMQNYNTPTHHETVKGPANSCSPARPQLKKAITKGA
jgi:hypothetical protein